LKRARLTKANFGKLERMGKPAGKGPTELSQKSKLSNSETKSTRSKQPISTTDSGFKEATFNNGILNHDSSKPPSNLKQLENQINQTRGSVSPSESEYRTFAHKIRTACNEQTVLLQTSRLLKEYSEPHSRYSKVYNHLFNAFPKSIGLNNGLSDSSESQGQVKYHQYPASSSLLTSGYEDFKRSRKQLRNQ
jgi:hypothetical protein